MPPTDQDEPSVTFPVRDLLDKLARDLGREIGDMRRTVNDKLDLLFQRLDAKADKADVTALEAEVRGIDGRVHAIEQIQAATKHHADAQKEERRWLWPLLLSFAVLLVMAAGTYLQYRVYHH